MTTHRPHQSRSQRFFAQQAPPWIRKLVGGVVMTIGLSLTAIGVLAAVRLLIVSRAIPWTPVTVALVIAAIGTFLIVVGRRLFIGRSRHRDSLLSRAAWFVLAAGFAVMTLWMATLGHWYENAVPLMSSLLFTTACAGIALRPRSTDYKG